MGPAARRRRGGAAAVLLPLLLPPLLVLAPGGEAFQDFPLHKMIRSPHPHPRPDCSRARCRDARAVLNEFFFPMVEREKHVLTERCPLHPGNDLYLEHERHKQMIKKSQWKSLYSDKLFKSEAFLDKHMDNRHMDKLPANATVCLGDYCDVLLCDVHNADTKAKRAAAAAQLRAPLCNPEAMQQSRHYCHVLMHKCFPPGLDPTTKLIADFFEQEFCEQLVCGRADTLFDRLRPKMLPKRSVGYYVAVALTFLGMLGFYGALMAYRRDTAPRADLKRVSGSRKPQKGWLAKLLRRKDKVY